MGASPDLLPQNAVNHTATPTLLEAGMQECRLEAGMQVLAIAAMDSLWMTQTSPALLPCNLLRSASESSFVIRGIRGAARYA